jgi:GNAT superfamily N-acetyltransferase
MTAAPAEVRPATRADAAALLTLASTFATSFVVDPARFDHSLDELLLHHDSALFVAVDGAATLGYVAASVHPTLYANGPVAWIEELMVAEEARGRGIGRALATAVEQWGLSRGVRAVSLATRRSATFWHAVGYEESAAYLRKLV